MAEKNASNTLMEKFGYTIAGAIGDPEEGPVWKWHTPLQIGETR